MATTTRIGSSVREQRTAANLTHEQLACLIGCDGNTIGRIERGEGDPSVRILKRLSEVFGLGIDEMMHTSQPTFASEMARCMKIIIPLWGETIEDCLRILEHSSRNDDVATFFHEMSARIESDLFRESIIKLLQWWKIKKELDEKLILSKRARDTASTLVSSIKKHQTIFPKFEIPLNEQVKKMLDYGQCIIVEKIFSPYLFADFSMHKFTINMEHFISILEA